MKRLWLLPILALTFIFAVSCGNRYPPSKESTPGWGISTQVAVPGMYTCVNLVDYEDFEYTKPASPPKQDTPTENKSETEVSSITNTLGVKGALPPVLVNAGMMGNLENLFGLAGGFVSETKSEEVIKCVETELKKTSDADSKFYWANRTWLIIKNEKLYSKPASQSITIEELKSCEQLKQADCYIID